MADVMILEPDAARRHQLGAWLTQAGYACAAAVSISEALPYYRHDHQLLTVLNARLPWVECLELLNLIKLWDWPVLFLTADPGNVEHLRTLFDIPCDALVYPHAPGKLIASVEHLRALSDRQLKLGSLRLDPMARRATLAGEHLTLTAQEFALLKALMESSGAVVSRADLLRTAWGYQDIGDTRTVDVHIQRLRRKLGKSCIETVYKTGYKLKMA